MITPEKAIKMLCNEYGKARTQEHIRNPLAYALYKVWKIADGEESKTGGRMNESSDYGEE